MRNVESQNPPQSRRRSLSESRPIPRRGVSRTEAAIYIGVSETTFDKMVEDGRMPDPFFIGTRKVWDLRKIDAAFDALSDADCNDESWNDFSGPGNGRTR